jgi:BNR repeat-containing family member
MLDGSPLAPPLRLADDFGWCWWTRPRATRIGQTVFFGGVDSGGGIVAARLDLSTGQVERHRLGQFEADDHNNPALLAVDGRPLICFYSRHDAPEGLRYRISGSPLSLDSWGAERLLAFGGSTTYAHVHVVDGLLHLFTRVDETRWGWRMSADWGETWSGPRDLLAFDTDQQVYVASARLADGHTLRLAASGHPKEYEKKPLHDVWAALVDLRSGEVRSASGKSLGNLRTGAGLPLDYPALDLVQRTPPGRTVNLFDVSAGPAFEIAYVSKIKDDHSTRDAQYHVATLRDGGWQVDTVAPAGRKFGYIDAGFYVGGMAFPDRGAGSVYLTREADGLWRLEEWRRDAGGGWIGRDLVTPSEQRLVRPWAISPPDPSLGVVALELEHYPEDDYMGTLSHLIGAPGGSA